MGNFNFIDITIVVILLFAIYSGAKRGLIVQLCSMLGIIVGIWLGVRYGESVGAMVGVSSDYAFVAGLAIVVVATTVIVAVVARLLKGVFSFVGLKGLDVILGAALAVCKYALIMSVLLGVFDTVNKSTNMVEKRTLSSSKLYRPIINVSDSLFPALDWTKQQIEGGLEKLQ